jgi:hypothetical protein
LFRYERLSVRMRASLTSATVTSPRAPAGAALASHDARPRDELGFPSGAVSVTVNRACPVARRRGVRLGIGD